jgi:hypothetical protein
MLCPHDFVSKLSQAFKEDLTPMLYKLIQTTEKVEMQANSFMSFMLTSYQDTGKKDHCRL